jgi:hypothetical protein
VGYHPFGHLAFDVIFEASGQALVEVRATDGGGLRGGPIDMCLVNNRTDRPGRHFARSLKLRLCRRVLCRDRGRVAGWTVGRRGGRHGGPAWRAGMAGSELQRFHGVWARQEWRNAWRGVSTRGGAAARSRWRLRARVIPGPLPRCRRRVLRAARRCCGRGWHRRSSRRRRWRRRHAVLIGRRANATGHG